MKQWTCLLSAAVLTLGFSALMPLSASAKGASFGSDRIVTFKTGTTQAQRQKIANMLGGKIVKDLPLIDAAVLRFSRFTTHTGVRLRSAQAVSMVEPDEYRIWIGAAAGLPTVGMVMKQAGALAGRAPALAGAPMRALLMNEEAVEKRSEVPWGVSRVGAPSVWDTTTGRGVRVAVIDTGVDFSHPDLAANYKGGYNVVDPEESPMDDQGHGTHVAGIIAASKNGKGVIGVAPEASIYGIKVLDANGGGTISSIIEGIAWAVDNKMQIANMSLGGPSTPAMERAVRRAYKAGLIIVAAAGNDPDASVSAPASYKETIAVSASTPEDGLASFSTIGEEVDVIAPGHKVLSAWPDSRLAELSGTSMASPHVAGLAALAYSLGARTPEDVRTMLKHSAVRLEGLSDSQQGAGMPRADRFTR